MSMQVEYKCDICRKELQRGATSPGSYSTGFGLRWDSTRGAGNVLRVEQNWKDCPLHLCADCIAQISDVASELRLNNKIAP